MRLEVITDPAEISSWSLQQQRSGNSVGLVPTMGALHAGHLGLVERAGSEVDRVVVSIFVNPTQFGPNEDLDAYPRTMEEDLRMLEAQGIAAVVFAPRVEGIYPTPSNKTWVTVDDMGNYLCGASRPGHFKGVTTVVSRLLTMVQPDRAFFGLKDAQQFLILKRMAQEMGFRTAIVGVPTVREPDGLAMSSRNRYLTERERAEAGYLSSAVGAAKNMIEHSGERNAKRVIAAMEDVLGRAKLGKTDYVEIVGADDLQPVHHLNSGATVLAAVAYYFGKARLIDNSIIVVP